jgi:hypothetical protein
LSCFVTGDEEDCIAVRIEDEQDPYLGCPGRTGTQLLEVVQGRALDPVGQRPAKARSFFQQRGDGLTPPGWRWLDRCGEADGANSRTSVTISKR